MEKGAHGQECSGWVGTLEIIVRCTGVATALTRPVRLVHREIYICRLRRLGWHRGSHGYGIDIGRRARLGVSSRAVPHEAAAA